MMALAEAVDILTCDLVGIPNDEFHNAFLTVAFSEERALEGTGFSPKVLKNSLAACLSSELGATHKVVAASVHSPNDVKAILVQNYLTPKSFIDTHLSRHKKPLDNYRLAAAILSYGPESPRFGDAMAYVIEEGVDVPDDVRNDVTQAFKAAAIEENIAAEQIAAFQ